MELYKKHVVLYGLKNLVPIAIILNADDRTKEPMIVVYQLFSNFGIHKCVAFHFSMTRRVVTWINY